MLGLDDNDDIGFVHEVRPIIEGMLPVVEPAGLYIVRTGKASTTIRTSGRSPLWQRDLEVVDHATRDAVEPQLAEGSRLTNGLSGSSARN